MARTARPWWRSQKQVWCVTIAGQRKTLGSHPQDAPRPKYNKKKDSWNVPEVIEDAWKAIQKGEAPIVAPDTSWALMDDYLEWCLKNRPASYTWYKKMLQHFKQGVPNSRVDQLKPFQVQHWLDKQTWGNNYKRGMVTAVKRVFNWAVKGGQIAANPLMGLEKPDEVHRDVVYSPQQFQKILALASDESFRDLLKFAWFTGVRPQEARLLEAQHIDHNRKVATYDLKISKGKKRRRVLHMTDEVYAITKRWAKRNPQGPIFRNSRGTQWTCYSIDCRFKRMKDELGFKPFSYAFRHSYIHHGLTKKGIDAVVMATLAGHKDTTMIMKVYGHLLKDTEFMRQAAKKATQR